MSNYLAKQSFAAGKFSIDVYPNVAPPDNRFENGAALQYGADFKTDFKRSGTQTDKIALLQLIFPQTPDPFGKTVGAWNVDKRAPGGSAITLGNGIYGAEGDKILATASDYYGGNDKRLVSTSECWLIDTPREVVRGFTTAGVFQGVTNTKFANYVVCLDSKDGHLFNQGVVWGYSFFQNSTNPAKFDVNIVPPKVCNLLETNEHIAAISTFLNITKDALKALIPG